MFLQIELKTNKKLKLTFPQLDKTNQLQIVPNNLSLFFSLAVFSIMLFMLVVEMIEQILTQTLINVIFIIMKSIQ